MCQGDVIHILQGINDSNHFHFVHYMRLSYLVKGMSNSCALFFVVLMRYAFNAVLTRNIYTTVGFTRTWLSFHIISNVFLGLMIWLSG